MAHLTEAQARQFKEQGFVAPFRFLAADKLAGYRRGIEETAAKYPAEIGRFNYGRHPWNPWIPDIHEDFLDAVEGLLGPNLLFSSMGYRIKDPGAGAYAGWHQDEFTLRYEPAALTCLFAFTELTKENGCLEVIPGSHKNGLLPHATKTSPDNYLSQGQHISVPVDEAKAVAVELEPGHAMIFDQRLIHGSGVNRSKKKRIACFADFCPPHARRGDGKRVKAVLLRGVDAHGNFDLE
ncbi:MAG: phytanoyl-CoA dioxygenase family protein [Rhodospirillales bacterium]|nr:phytanoyl-CoA dioxygenase family protein [Rhodospirillales bacterium]